MLQSGVLMNTHIVAQCSTRNSLLFIYATVLVLVPIVRPYIDRGEYIYLSY